MDIRNCCKFEKGQIAKLMQSFIINVPKKKVAFFLQLIEQLDLEILELEEGGEGEMTGKPIYQKPPEPDDPFLDWDEERKNAKKNKY